MRKKTKPSAMDPVFRKIIDATADIGRRMTANENERHALAREHRAAVRGVLVEVLSDIADIYDAGGKLSESERGTIIQQLLLAHDDVQDDETIGPFLRIGRVIDEYGLYVNPECGVGDFTVRITSKLEPRLAKLLVTQILEWRESIDLDEDGDKYDEMDWDILSFEVKGYIGTGDFREFVYQIRFRIGYGLEQGGLTPWVDGEQTHA